MDENTQWLTADDGTRLFVRRWRAPSPRGAGQIVHGMAEHSLRYRRAALELAGAGFDVWAMDLRGHGETARSGGNSPGSGGLLGHCADRRGFTRTAADLDVLRRRIEEELPHTPLFMLGHSWGSFLVQYYIERQGAGLAGCVFSGTRGPCGSRMALAYPLLALIALLNGCRRRSALAFALADRPYNKPFRPNRTPFDWISRDEAEVDLFIKDPSCGFRCSSGFYRDLIWGLREIHKPGAIERIAPDLPVYIFCGSADPVGDMGESPTALVNAYRSAGLRDLEFVLYPDARHECLNETNREEVTHNLIDWLTRHTGGN